MTAAGVEILLLDMRRHWYIYGEEAKREALKGQQGDADILVQRHEAFAKGHDVRPVLDKIEIGDIQGELKFTVNGGANGCKEATVGVCEGLHGRMTCDCGTFKRHVAEREAKADDARKQGKRPPPGPNPRTGAQCRHMLATTAICSRATIDSLLALVQGLAPRAVATEKSQIVELRLAKRQQEKLEADVAKYKTALRVATKALESRKHEFERLQKHAAEQKELAFLQGKKEGEKSSYGQENLALTEKHSKEMADLRASLNTARQGERRQKELCGQTATARDQAQLALDKIKPQVPRTMTAAEGAPYIVAAIASAREFVYIGMSNLQQYELYAALLSQREASSRPQGRPAVTIALDHRMLESALPQAKQLTSKGAQIKVFAQSEYSQKILVTENHLVIGGAYEDAEGAKPPYQVCVAWHDPSPHGERAAQKAMFEQAVKEARTFDAEAFERQPMHTPPRGFDDQSREAAKAAQQRRAAAAP